jgi:hypothetical protein
VGARSQHQQRCAKGYGSHVFPPEPGEPSGTSVLRSSERARRWRSRAPA